MIQFLVTHKMQIVINASPPIIGHPGIFDLGPPNSGPRTHTTFKSLASRNRGERLDIGASNIRLWGPDLGEVFV